MPFNERLKELRKSRHLTQDEFSKQSGIGRSAVSMYESGKRMPSYETLEQIADFFNVSMGSLIERTEHQTAPPTAKDDVDDIFDDHDIRALARKTLTGKSPEEIEKKKKKLKQMLEVMFDE
ncbi:helix-turn-helix domain-containing protein [Selenomonas sp. FC4001]|uniref:helix-turn-helix domain-containing protein n=1 Tax=Selenomonas sp. FC4001 TaxID=1408313 RepID=UPI00055ADF42|nr:helix-turn-helix transcriptional regulator [Selenomonas sp. FC4001]